MKKEARLSLMKKNSQQPKTVEFQLQPQECKGHLKKKSKSNNYDSSMDETRNVT